MKNKNQVIETYIDGLFDFQKDIVRDTRHIILSSNSEIKEQIKWGSIVFYNKKNICGYRIAKKHVTLLFMEGVRLNDPNKNLNGTGSKARTLIFKNAEDIDAPILENFIGQSLKMGM